MTLTQLSYLIAVDNHRHFARAAEACFVTQPTLSMQIQKLEEELGVLLFDRSKHPVRPTTIGEKLIGQARTILHEAERMNQILQESKNVLEGPFKLGIIPTVTPSLVPRFLSKFTAKFPKIQLQVIELTTELIVEKLQRDELDAGILATPLKERSIIEKPLYYEPFMAYIPQDHRLGKESFVTNSELDIDEILLLNEGHCFRNSVINLCHSSPSLGDKNVDLESGNFDILVKLSKQGYGMTLVPYLYAIDLAKEEQVNVKPIADPKPTREISLVYSRAELKIKVIEEIGRIIQSSIPEKLLNTSEQVLSPVTNV
ncbi:MAG: LysR substrate-binding domain-containing protein [Bacteroidetes bacterium]|nr:LysR substrate-binding domain-containing protein [Bacteroidota bacterium]